MASPSLFDQDDVDTVNEPSQEEEIGMVNVPSQDKVNSVLGATNDEDDDEDKGVIEEDAIQLPAIAAVITDNSSRLSISLRESSPDSSVATGFGLHLTPTKRVADTNDEAKKRRRQHHCKYCKQKTTSICSECRHNPDYGDSKVRRRFVIHRQAGTVSKRT